MDESNEVAAHFASAPKFRIGIARGPTDFGIPAESFSLRSVDTSIGATAAVHLHFWLADGWFCASVLERGAGAEFR